MSIATVDLTPAEAQRLTQRIKLTAVSIRDNMVRLNDLVAEAKAGSAHLVLGFASWTAYLADTLGEEPLRLNREERQEVVAMLAGEGMSTRAIAPIVSVDNKTVHNDIQAIKARVENSTPAAPVSDTHHEFPAESSWSPSEGFTDEPVEPSQQVQYDDGEWSWDVEVAVDPAPMKTVTGLDGKSYPVKPREPKPVLSHDAAAELNAKTGVKYLGRALETMLGLTYKERRTLFLTDWWPRAYEEVPHSQRDLWNPDRLR
jgi:hypothetical protein